MSTQQGQLVQRGPLSIGDKLSCFNKKAVLSTENGTEIIEVDQKYEADKWKVMFWWPKDFTFVCPTDIIEFDKSSSAFADRNAVVIGSSTDSEYVHLGWRQSHPGLAALRIPMLADTSKSLAEEMGILEKGEKIAYRATFIIDPDNVIQWVSNLPDERREECSGGTLGIGRPADRRTDRLRLECRRSDADGCLAKLINKILCQ